jgi:precorrin-2/cobalt-factor-2 C20-methyltransferase
MKEITVQAECRTMAKIYAVGVGPGDPELLTRKAERILREVAVVCAPTAGPGDPSHALAIAEPFLDRTRQEILFQVFPMRKDQEGLDRFWEQAVLEVVDKVRQGLDVAFITIGDPMLYSTFLYLYRILRERYPEVPVEVVPGISSIHAAAAASGAPLGIATERIAVIPAAFAEEELRRTLRDFETVILMKVSSVFDTVYRTLRELGLERNGVYVSRVGSPEQRVETDLARLVGQKLDYLSLLIVKREPWQR